MKKLAVAIIVAWLLLVAVIADQAGRKFWESISVDRSKLVLIADLGGVRVFEDRMGGAVVYGDDR